MKYREIIADNLSKAGWSLSCVSAFDSDGRTIWIADVHRGDGKRFVVRADEKLTAFLELEKSISQNTEAKPKQLLREGCGGLRIDGIADCIRLAVPEPTGCQRIGNQVNAAFVFARSDFVFLDAMHSSWLQRIG